LIRTFAVNASGNRTASNDAAGVKAYKLNTGTDAINQYDAITTNGNTLSRDHDNDGNLTNDGSKKYVFDAEDRLIKVTDLFDTEIVSYRYDSYSRAIERIASLVTQQFVYNGWNIVARYREETTGWNLVATWTWGLDVSRLSIA
jgi:YD repeat-containing protein